VVGEYGAGGALIAHFSYGAGLTSLVDTHGVASYYDFDNLGSTAGLSGPDGEYEDNYSYAPFGGLLTSSESVGSPFQFVGEWGVMQDQSGLDFMRARSYSSDNGRFVTIDPLGPVGGDANTYGYALNSVTNLNDPSGLCPWCLALLAGAGEAAGGAALEGAGAAALAAVGEFLTDAAIVGSGLLAGWGIQNAARSEPIERFPNGKPVDPAEPNDPWGDKTIPDPLDEPVTDYPNPGDPDIGRIPNKPGSLGGGGRTQPGFPNPFGPGGGGNGLFWPGPNPPTPPSRPGPLQPSQPGLIEAVDPNDSIGPGGFGPAGFIAPGGPLPYRIDFENEATATAPAQRVVVTDQLDPNFDWNTFELTAVGFGNTDIIVPPGSQHFQTTVDLTENGQPIEVDIELGLNPQTGLITATFQTIDPRTQLPPDVLTGFLPPEDGTGRGKGYFTYIVMPKAGLPTGTQIRNVASVVFDANAPITTDQVDDNDPSKGVDPAKQDLITIDAGPPTSSVTPLPATETSANFTVSWSGQDDPGGSGIASYDIDVSDNGGPFVPFLTDTTQTSASFAGVNGHTYSFWSVATDNVGNVQATPTSAQATTKVVVSSSTGTPHVGAIATPVVAVRLATSVNFSAPFTQPGASGPHTAIWSWGDGTTLAGKVTESNGSGSVSGSHVYAAAGFYRVTLTVTDTHKRSGSATAAEALVVYNPTAGSITGKGAITSPAGAVASNPKLTG